MSEVESIINRYFRKDSRAIVYYNIDQELFNKIIINMTEYERPDILSVFDNLIVGIEHFEFDSFKNNRKGSDFKIKDNVIVRDMKEKINTALKDNDSITVHSHIDSSATLDNYFRNFKNIFIEHYNKIDSYIKHIKEDFDCTNKEISICFFADDVSPLGSYFLDQKREINLLNPLYSDVIIDMLKESPKVKYLIIGTYAMSDYKLIIIENNKQTLDRFKKERKQISEDNFFAFSPQTTGFAVKVSGDEIENNN